MGHRMSNIEYPEKKKKWRKRNILRLWNRTLYRTDRQFWSPISKESGSKKGGDRTLLPNIPGQSGIVNYTVDDWIYRVLYSMGDISTVSAYHWYHPVCPPGQY